MQERQQVSATPKSTRKAASGAATDTKSRTAAAQLQSRIGANGVRKILAQNGKSGGAAKKKDESTKQKSSSAPVKSQALQPQTQSAAEVETVQAPSAETAKPVIIYIGGAADDWFSHIVESYASGKGIYFSWTDRSAVTVVVKMASQLGRPIAIAGHSLGGAVALGAVGDSKVFVDLVITIDPVGYPGSFDRAKIGYWLNVLASPATYDQSDYIADIGIKTAKGITGAANKSVTSKQHHWNFVAMMGEGGADALIKSVGSGAEKPGGK